MTLLKYFFVLVMVICICTGSMYSENHNALIKLERNSRQHGNNKYNSAKHIFDYDELLEEQEENDLFVDEYNEYNEDTDTDGDDESDDESDDGDNHGEYSEKEQLTAFLLSFFLGGVGAGRFYVGDYAVASIKLCLPLIICVVVCIVACVTGCLGVSETLDSGGSGDDGVTGLFEKLSGGAGIGAAISSCGCCAWQIWWLVDWILFAMNEIPDSQGKTLYPM
eukprot:96375_1